MTKRRRRHWVGCLAAVFYCSPLPACSDTTTNADSSTYYENFCKDHCMTVPAECAEATAEQQSACLQECLLETNKELVNCDNACAVVGWSYEICKCSDNKCAWAERVSPNFSGDWLFDCTSAGAGATRCKGFVVFVNFHGNGLGCDPIDCHP